MPLISVIVPIYNAEKFLDKCLDSISNQSYKNLEIILINDGSTDSSLDICQKWKSKDERIILIDRENEGVSKSRNEGIDIAKGDYISFVDSDDFLDKDCFNILMKNNNDYDIIVSNYFILNGEKKENGISSEIGNDYLNELFNGNIKGYLWNKLYRKDVIGEIKFNEKVKMCEDLLFNYSVACKNDISFVYVDSNLYYYVQNDDSAVRKFDFDITKFYAYNEIICLLENNNKNYSDIWKFRFILSYNDYKVLNHDYERNNDYNELYLLYKRYRDEVISNSFKIRLKIFMSEHFNRFYYKKRSKS